MPGTIVFKPLEANIVTKDKDLLGRMDPYLSFHLGGLKRVKGEVAKSGGQHPIWNDAITVEVTDQTSLTVDLKDKDMLIDDKIGSFEVDLRELASQGRVRKWYPIFRRNEPAGELLMEATFNGGNLGQYGVGQTQGAYGLGQGQYGQGQSQSQYGLSQGQGQYGLSQGQGQYGLSQGQGQYGLSQGSTGVYGQSGHVITTPGTVISHTSTSYPVQTTTHSSTQHSTQYSSSGLQQGQYSASGLQQGQYGLQQGQYGGLQQGQLGGTSSKYGGLQQGQLGGLQQGQLGGISSQYSGIPQNQLGGVSSQYGGFPQTQSYGAPSTEQFAKEALLRGSDPLNTQQNYYHNAGLGGSTGHLQGQNLTQTPSFSGTDPLLYEGDKNRFSNPPQQMSYPGKTVETYGHKHHGTTNPGVNPTVNPNVNPNTKYY